MIAILTSSSSCAMVASSDMRHLEAAVADDHPDFRVGPRELGADGGGKSEAHRAEAAGGDERARLVVLVVLRFPHLVLAHVGDDQRVALGLAPQIVDDVRGVEMPVVGQVLDVAHGRVALELVECSCQPLGRDRPLRTRGSRSSSTSSQIADERDVDLHVLVDLGRIDVDVNLLRVGRVGLQVAGDAIVEAHAEGEQQVGLLDGLC